MNIEQTTIHPTGINRDASTTDASHCEAILGLRPDGNTWHAANDKSRYQPDCQQDGFSLLTFHQHILPSGTQLIALRSRLSGQREKVNLYTATIDHTAIATSNAPGDSNTDNNSDGDTDKDNNTAVQWTTLLTLLTDVKSNQIAALAEQVQLTSMGSYLCISTPDLHIYSYRQGSYQPADTTNGTPPELHYSVSGQWSSHGTRLCNYPIAVRGTNCGGCYYREYATDQYPLDMLQGETDDDVSLVMGDDNTPKKWGNLTYNTDQKQQLMTAMAGEWEAQQTSTRTYREGYVLVSAAWQLADGSTTCPSAPVLLHLGCEQIAADFAAHAGHTFNPQRDIDVYYNPDKISFKLFWANNLSTDSDVNAQFTCYLRHQWQQQLTFSRPPAPAANGEGSLVRKAVYYVSLPLSMYNFAQAEFDYLHTIYHYGLNSSTSGIESGGAEANRYYRLSLKRSQTDREGLPEHLPSANELSSALLYKAVEYDLTDATDTADKTVNFSTLSSGDVLPVDASGHSAYSCQGMLVYNQRLHIWDLGERLRGQMVPSTSLSLVPAGGRYAYTERQISAKITERNVVKQADGTPWLRPAMQTATSHPCWVIYQLSTDRQQNLNHHLYHYRQLTTQLQAQNSDGSLQWLQPPFISFPDSRCDRCILLVETSADHWQQTELAMQPASSGNWSFSLGLSVSSTLSNTMVPYLSQISQPAEASLLQRLDDIGADGQTYADLISPEGSLPALGGSQQADCLKVSALSNPCLFPPAQSYTYDSQRIMACGIATHEVSAAQSGQYPLCVFTQGGIWAMGIGSETAYASQVPISAEVSISHSVLPTPIGLVFVSANGAKALQGRISVDLSSEAWGDPCQTLWQNPTIQDLAYGHHDKLSQTALLILTRGGLALSLPQLLDAHCRIGYDALHGEIVFGNTQADCDCSYTYHLGSKRWSAQRGRYRHFEGAYALRCDERNTLGEASIPVRGGLYKLTAEAREPTSDGQCVLLVTRPVRLQGDDYQLVREVVLRGHFSLAKSCGTGFYLAGSNDLLHWQVLSVKHFTGQFLTQVVLPRSKWSYRFFSVMICGRVQPDFVMEQIEVISQGKFGGRRR